MMKSYTEFAQDRDATNSTRDVVTNPNLHAERRDGLGQSAGGNLWPSGDVVGDLDGGQEVLNGAEKEYGRRARPVVHDADEAGGVVGGSGDETGGSRLLLLSSYTATVGGHAAGFTLGNGSRGQAGVLGLLKGQ